MSAPLGDADLTACAGFAIAEEILSKSRHDLRNRLSTIQNASFYLKRKTQTTPLWEAEPRIAAFFDVIHEEIQRALLTLGEETSAATLRPRSVAPSGLAPCIARALGGLRVPEGMSVEVSVAVATEVLIEPTEVALAARCLLENAIEASATSPASVVLVRSFQTPDAVVLEIEDAGAGFNAEASPQPFETTKPGHAGLGLAVARRAVERSGGSLSLRSASTGTVARISFPLNGTSARADDV